MDKRGTEKGRLRGMEGMNEHRAGLVGSGEVEHRKKREVFILVWFLLCFILFVCFFFFKVEQLSLPEWGKCLYCQQNVNLHKMFPRDSF